MGIGIGIYGLNISGCMAAVEAGRRSVKTELSGPAKHKGGMWATGLGQTDREATGVNATSTALRMGLSKELETRFGAKSGGNGHLFPTMKVVDEVINEMLAEVADYVTVRTGVELESVEQDGVTGELKAMTVGGKRVLVSGACDDTDELDLARRLKCLTRIGRDSVLGTGEPTAGMRPAALSTALAYDPTTGERRPGVAPRPAQALGAADRRLMAFNMRLIVTQDATRINWADLAVTVNPRDYDADLELAVASAYKTIPMSIGRELIPIVGPQTQDGNNGGLLRIGSNWIGEFLDWPSMNWTSRNFRKDEYIKRTAGLFKTMCTDAQWAARVPEMVADAKTWGLVPGLWTDSVVPGFSPDIYVRGAYRLVGKVDRRFDDIILPERNTVAEPVHVGGYPQIDAHWYERFAHESGVIAFEGGGGLNNGQGPAASQMPLGALQARLTDCPNLMVSRGTSGTMLGWITSRIELVYIKNGQVCGMALALADQLGVMSGKLPYTTALLPALNQRGFILTIPGAA